MKSRNVDTAKNKASKLLDGLEHDLVAGKISEGEWYAKVTEVIVPAYIGGGNPRAESGYSGTAEQWERARSLVLEAVDKSGSFLDIGCANGLLMESLEAWGTEKGLVLEVHGLDISPELIELSKKRLPRHANQLYVGNAANWIGPNKFEFVRTGLEYVPSIKQKDFVTHLLKNIVTPGGRLIIGVFNEERDEFRKGQSNMEGLMSMGFTIKGHAERPHRSNPGLQYKVLWIDNIAAISHEVAGE